MSTLNVRIPERLHDNLRIAKVKEKRAIEVIVSDALENYFKPKQKPDRLTDPPAPYGSP